MALNPAIVDRSDIETYLSLAADVTDADRGLIELLRQGVENTVRGWLGHNVTQATYTEYHPRYDRASYEGAEYINVTDDAVQISYAAPDGEILYLDQMFVRSITTIHEDTAAVFGQGSGDFAAATLLTSGTDYYRVIDDGTLSRCGIVRRTNGSWSGAPGTIKVVYVAGLSAAELDGAYSDIRNAVLEEIVLKYKVAKARAGSDGAAGVVQQEKIAGIAYIAYEATSIQMALQSLSDPVKERLNPYRRLRL